MGLITGIILASFSFVDVLNQAAEQGVFAYVLPFLLVFALVFGILSKSKIIGENKGVLVLISVALGLLSLVGDVVPSFFQDIAPKLGIALMILLACLILLSLFYDPKDEKGAKWLLYVFIAVGVIAFVSVTYSSLSNYSFQGSFIWAEYGPSLIVLIIIGVIIGLAVQEPKTHP